MPGLMLKTKNFVTVPGTAWDALDYSSGQKRVIRCNKTGWLIRLAWTSADSLCVMQISENDGASWQTVASVSLGVTNANMIQSFDQDSAGALHVLSFSSTNHNPYYSRLSLTISGGRITGFTVSQSATALPTHSPDASSDARGDIKVVVNGSTEKVVWTAQIGTTGGPNTDFKGYIGQMSALTGTATSSGIDGTGTDTNYLNSTGSLRTNHGYQSLLDWEPTSQTLYIYNAQMNLGDNSGAGTGSQYDLIAIPFTVSSGNWAQQSTVTVSTAQASGIMPLIMSTFSAPGLCGVQYYSPNGVCYAKFNSSGTLTDRYVAEPFTVGTGTGANGATWTDGTIIFSYYVVYDSLLSNGRGFFAYYNGTVWEYKVVNPNAATQILESFYGFYNKTSTPYLAAQIGIGSSTAQSRTGDAVAVMYFYTPTTTLGVARRKKSRRPIGFSQRLKVREWIPKLVIQKWFNQNLNPPSATSGPTGTGALTATKETMAGTGTRGVHGTGALLATKATASGSGKRRITGTGTPTVNKSTVAATGTRHITGSGSPAATNATVDGTGTVGPAGGLHHTGTGDLQVTKATATGTGKRGVHGTGALSVTKSTVAGIGKTGRKGIGALTAHIAAVTGAGKRGLSGFGSIAAAKATIAGTAKKGMHVVVSLVAKVATIVANAVRGVIGTGDIASKKPTVFGIAPTPPGTGANFMLIDTIPKTLPPTLPPTLPGRSMKQLENRIWTGDQL